MSYTVFRSGVANYNPDYNRLSFIKTLQTTSGKTEIYTASSGDDYATIERHDVTPLLPSDTANGKFLVDAVICFLNTANNTPTRKVELYCLAYEDNTRFDVRTATPFWPSEVGDGIFTMDSSSLYFIKTKKTASGFVEVFIARQLAAGDFYLRHFHLQTAFKASEVSDGYLTIDAGDLYYIKTRNTQSGFVELHKASFKYAYSGDITVSDTTFKTIDDQNGVWAANNGSVYFIKTKNCASGRIELHINMFPGTKKSVEYYYATVFNSTEASNGVWQLDRNIYLSPPATTAFDFAAVAP